eukprot:2626598-Prymnesium_polylepis.1
MDECHPVHARGELGNAQEVALAFVLRPAAVREDKDALEAELLAIVLQNAPNVGRDDALAVLLTRRVGDDEDVHVAARRVLACARAERLVVVLGGEVGRDAHLMLAKGGVGQVALVGRPAVDPIVWRPLQIELLQPLHQLLACALDRHQLVPEGVTLGVNPWAVLLPLGIIIVAILDGAFGHRGLPAAVAAVATVTAGALGALGSMVACRIGQRGTATLAPRREGDLAARRMDEGTELGERARRLAVGTALGALAAAACCSALLVLLAVPLLALRVPPACGLTH